MKPNPIKKLARPMRRRIDEMLTGRNAQLELIRQSTYVPDPADNPLPMSTPFMAYSTCHATDCYHPRYLELCQMMDCRPVLHRKYWEWAFILHHLIERGVLTPGSQGLAFGVGTEPLPAVFASMGVDVTATDAPAHLEAARNWHSRHQYSGTVEQLLRPAVVPDDVVRARVRHQFCDMNAIDPSLTGFDFNWSSCCFEHLGSLEQGIEFVVNAVEKTLKVGGVAVHTTEFNMSSNEDTVENGETVLYRKRDIERLIDVLQSRGHDVAPFRVGPTTHVLDFHVDVPPYSSNPHLKLLLKGYVATSVGIVVRRGC